MPPHAWKGKRVRICKAREFFQLTWTITIHMFYFQPPFWFICIPVFICVNLRPPVPHCGIRG